jgi:hypothetical protein
LFHEYFFLKILAGRGLSPEVQLPINKNNNLGVPLAFGKPQARVGRPSGLGRWPRAAMALCRFAAGPGGIALQRDLQSDLTRKQKTFNCQP